MGVGTAPRRGPVTGLARLRSYDRAWLRADALAGITVTAYLVPQCLAYAGLAGVPPILGLWVAVSAMVVYAFLGTSRLLSVGPESAIAIMVAAAVAPRAAGDPAHYLALSAGLAIMVGLVCVAAWALRLGFVADLLSQPILIGYMAGVALIMIGSQLGTLSGLQLDANDTVGRLIELGGQLRDMRPITLGVGLAVVVFLLVLHRFKPLAPGTLLAVVGAALVVWVFALDSQGVDLVGAVPGGLPTASLPDLEPSDIGVLLGSAAAIAFVAYTEVALNGRAFAARTGDEIDPNREFLALGVVNVVAGLLGGFAASASGSRTAIIDAMRARSQVAGLVAAGTVVFVILAVPGLISHIPRAALAGVVVYAAMRLVDVAGVRRLARFRSSELWLAVAAFVGVLAFDVLAGILVAVALSVVDLFARVARPPAAVLGRVPGLAGLHNVEDYPDARTIPGLVVFRYDAPLCFANAYDFRARALAAVDAVNAAAAQAVDGLSAGDDPVNGQAANGGTANGGTANGGTANGRPVPVDWFLLNAEAIVELDTTATEVIAQLVKDLAERHVVFTMARVKQELRAQMVRGGLMDVIDEERLYPTLPVAVEAYEAWRERR